MKFILNKGMVVYSVCWFHVLVIVAGQIELLGHALLAPSFKLLSTLK